MQAKLKSNLYDLADSGIHQQNIPDGANVLSLDLLNVPDLDTLRSDATDCEVIQIMDGETETAAYYDYVTLRNIAVNAETETTTVMMKQESIVRQVTKLRQTVASQAATIASQAQTIADQAATIANQQALIEDLNSSQADQDDQITEIQEVLVEM